jgi:hypothetical protein
MILYKYASLEAGLKILESGSIGFTEPRDFNDPFETAARPRGGFGEFPGLLIQAEGDAKPHRAPFLFTCNNHTTNIWSSNFAVLSLTRQPLNKLMLAHYADEHKGMVIGFYISRVPDFTSEKWAYVPAQHGNVIYTATLPEHSTFKGENNPYTDVESVGIEGRQRAFLYKDSAWHMEEEVRIVKFLKDSINFFNVIYIEDRPLYLYPLPDAAIIEVYFGVRAKILPAMDGDYNLWLRLKNALSRYGNCRLFQIDVALESWDVTKKEVTPGAYDGYWQLHFDRQAID